MGILDGKKIVITGVLTDASLAFAVARTALAEGAEIVLTGAGRALSLTLTARGVVLTQKIVPFALRYEEVAMEGMTARQVATLKTLLKRVYTNLETVDRKAAARPAAKKRPAVRRRKRSVKASV